MKYLTTILFTLMYFISMSQNYYPIKEGQYAIYDSGSTGTTTIVSDKYTYSASISYKNPVYAVDTIMSVESLTSLDTLSTFTRPSGKILGISFPDSAIYRGQTITIDDDSIVYFTKKTNGNNAVFNGAEVITDWTRTGSSGNLVTDGDFEGSDWLSQTGWTESGGYGVATSVANGNVIYQTNIITEGVSYVITFTVVSITEGAFKSRIGSEGSVSAYDTPGTYTDTLVAGAVNFVGVGAVGTTSGTIDNFSIEELNASNIWVTPSPLNHQSAYRTVVVIDDDRFMPVDLLSNLDADLEFFVEDSTGTVGDSIYVYSLIDPATRTAELSTELYGIQDGLEDVRETNHDITIRNLDFRYYGYAGINIAGDEPNGNYLIDNCTFYFNRQAGVQFFEGHDNNTVQNSTSTYNGNGFYANFADNSSFINNTVTNTIAYDAAVSATDGHGIGCYKANNTLIESNYMENNQGSNIGYDTPSADFPNNGIIRYNTLKANSNSGGSCLGGNYIAAGCVVDAYYNVIVSDKNNNYAVSYNYVYGKLNLYNNTIIQSGEVDTPIRLNHADSVVFKNNIVFNASGGANGVALLWIYNDGIPVSDNNLWYDDNSLPQFAQKQGVANYTTMADWTTATSQDANSIESDPLFTTEFTDLTLQTGSPAINNGVDVGLTTDILGNPIVGLPDIGAYEKQ